ncbi:MATE family efflux transporter [Faecalimonas sp.]
MKKHINLLEGPILPSLSGLALPIMATSLIQMAYNLTDMIWIGRVGSSAVAAVGAAGMYMWLANGLATLAKMGGQVKVAQALGARENKPAVSYAKSALQLGITLGLIYGILAIVLANPLIDFFKLNSTQVVADARIYLQITCGGVIFSFLNQIFTGIMTAMGNSKTSFVATSVGLIINIIMDPVLIFGIGPFAKMGVMGAGIATVFAQMIVTGVFILAALKDEIIFQKVHLLEKVDKESMREIVKIGLPTGVQSMIFTSISMIIARMIAGFGDSAVAVQKVGSQIESISWMTAEGFGAAVNAFMAQNHGANNKKRIVQGYKVAMRIEIVWGIFCTFVLMVFPKAIFKIFIPEANVLPMGVDYLKILGMSQLFMCIELTTAGAFSGLGKTIPPSVSSIILTASRIPMAIALTSTTLGLNGIWWSIAISSIFKGVILVIWFLMYLKKMLSKKE